MSVDDQFLEMFFEEARELLMVLEEGLMELESRQGDRAFVDKVFRSAHSIKGAAAMVGLSHIAGFTDLIETVLDRIRSQVVPVDSDIISVLLESRDQLSTLVDAAERGTVQDPPPPLIERLQQCTKPPSERVQVVSTPKDEPEKPVTSDNAESINQSVPTAESPKPADDTAENDSKAAKPKRKRTRSKPGKTNKTKAESAAALPPDQSSKDQTESSSRASQSNKPPDMTPPSGSESDAVPPRGYRIRFAPGSDVFKRGMNPLGVLDELSELGEAFLTVDPSSVPTLESIDPRLNYLAWEIELRTEEPIDRVQDVFLFVGEDCRIEISELKEFRQDSYESTSILAKSSAIAPEAGTHLLPADLANNLTPAGSETSATSRLKDSAPTEEKPDQPNSEQQPEADTRTSKVIRDSIENSGLAKTPPAMPEATSESATRTQATLSPASVEALSHVVRSASSRAAVSGTSTVNKSASTPRIRVDAGQLDDLVGLAGELAVLADNLQGLREINGAEPYRLALESLERVCRQVRDQSLELRMVPVEELFSRFPRLVRDLADKSGKEIQLRIEGQETRLDRTIVEKLAEPMIHLIRNSVDHGLETPEERVANGKPRQGRVLLWAGHEGDRVALKIEDDGRGLNRQRIVEKGIARGLIPANTPADDPRVVGLIFEPGFSTRDSVSEISGRGVGLDVVRDAVRALRGSVSVQSEPGRGTCFTFRLPLTLALIDGLLVEVAHERYVVPLSQVEECVALGGTRPALSSGRMCVSVRDELVPLVNLRSMFEAISPTPKRQEILLTRHGGQRVGIAVDKLLGRVQAVIQSLGEGLSHLGRFSGATILGDGEVSLILDLSSIVAESRAAEVRADQARALTQPEVIS